MSILIKLPVILPKHFIFLELLIIPVGAFFVKDMLVKVKTQKNIKLIFILLLLISLFYLGLSGNASSPHFYGKSATAQIIDFKDDSIPTNALIVQDSRFYRGRSHWSSQGRPYLEGTQFLELIRAQPNMEGDSVLIDIYFVECVRDDCGWGTIKNQPEFNASMESLVQSFSNQGNLVKTIYEPNKESSYYPFIDEKDEAVKIYKLNTDMKRAIPDFANQPKEWFLYNVGYEPGEEVFDYYFSRTIFQIFLHKLAGLMVWISIILAFLSPLYLIYLVSKR